MDKWIKCSERLPEHNGEFLAICVNIPSPSIVCWNNEEPFSTLTNLGLKKGWWGYGVYMGTGVTHWMALPEPPEDK